MLGFDIIKMFLHYDLTRYKGDWDQNFKGFIKSLFFITIWPDIKGIETIRFSTVWDWLTITIWPDIKGIET